MQKILRTTSLSAATPVQNASTNGKKLDYKNSLLIEPGKSDILRAYFQILEDIRSKLPEISRSSLPLKNYFASDFLNDAIFDGTICARRPECVPLCYYPCTGRCHTRSAARKALVRHFLTAFTPVYLKNFP